MKKLKKILIRTFIGLTSLTLILLIAITIYASTSYTALEASNEAINTLETSNITKTSSSRHITLTVSNPKANIVFVPGGLVEPDSYLYLATSLAVEGYNVTIFKPFFNLAIFTPNFAAKYLNEDLDNIVIGHSLGGVVASMFSSENDLVDKIIFMGSYPIQDLNDKDVLIISAEHDIAMDEEAFNDSLTLVNDDTIQFMIDGGNHAQFGWYGPQKGDGDPEISTIAQQTIVIEQILLFIEGSVE